MRSSTGMKKGFEDRVVYITGGSSGIGLAAAELMAAGGAHVVIFARRIGPLEEAARQIRRHRASDARPCGYYQLDVADPEAVKQVMTRAVTEFGIPGILINSAGRAKPDYFASISFEQFDETMKINVYGTWNTIAVLAPQMQEKGGGHIVNVASIAGFLGLFGYADYCASKFAVVGLSEVLRNEFKPMGIRVSVLCPPDTDTPGYALENIGKPPETRAISQTAKLMSARDVAREMMRGMSQDRFMIIPGMDGRLVYLIKRWLPGVVERVLDHAVKKARGKKTGS
ncbi:MAG: SDR family oxidoreductase [Thermodesulfobacteriota bacterium]